MSVVHCYTRRHNFREHWVKLFEADLTTWWNSLEQEEQDEFTNEITDFVGGSELSTWGTYFTNVRKYIKKAAKALLITCPKRRLRGNKFTLAMETKCNLAEKVMDYFFQEVEYTTNTESDEKKTMSYLQWSLAAEYIHKDLYDLENWENTQHQAAVEQIEKCRSDDMTQIDENSAAEANHWKPWIDMICHRHFLNDTNGGASSYCEWFPLAAKKCQEVVNEAICDENESQNRRRNLKLLKDDLN